MRSCAPHALRPLWPVGAYLHASTIASEARPRLVSYCAAQRFALQSVICKLSRVSSAFCASGQSLQVHCRHLRIEAPFSGYLSALLAWLTRQSQRISCLHHTVSASGQQCRTQQHTLAKLYLHASMLIKQVLELRIYICHDQSVTLTPNCKFHCSALSSACKFIDAHFDSQRLVAGARLRQQKHTTSQWEALRCQTLTLRRGAGLMETYRGT